MPDLDDVDSGWEDEDHEAVDSGWDDPEAPGGQEPSPQGMTPEESQARAARAVARKDRLRAKTLEKAQRRKARASAAVAKQKKSAPRVATTRSERPPGIVEEQEPEIAESVPPESPVSNRTVRPAPDWRRILLVALLLVVGAGVALLLWRR